MFKHLLIVIGLGALRIIGNLPLCLINFLGGIIGSMLFYVLRSRRRVGMVNLNLCFPNWSKNRKTMLLKGHFKELVRSSMCYGWIFYASKEKLSKNIVIRGLENFTKHQGKTPVILLAPHFLALDLGANRLSVETPGYSIYSTQRNKYLSTKIKAARLRFIKDLGGEIFSRQEGLRTIIRKIRQSKYPFYYLPDQDMDARDSIFVPFFAHSNCATLAVLPKLVKLTGGVVISMMSFREGNKYVVELSEVWNNYPTGDEFYDVSFMNRKIEEMVLKEPTQYLWLHKRFKTQPGLKRGILYKD